MRVGYRVATAGLVVVLGCSVAAFGSQGSTSTEGVSADVPGSLITSQSRTSAGAASPAEGRGRGVSDDGSSGPSSRSADATGDSTAGSAALPSPDAGSASEGLSVASVASADDSYTGPQYADGTYRATGQGKIGQVPVTVVIEDGLISSVKIGQNSETGLMADEAAQVVIPQILETQSTEDIDAATGATCTSEAIVSAVASALERASAAV